MFSHLSPPESPPEHPGNLPASSHTGTAHMCTHPSHWAIHVNTSVRLGSYWASPQACSLSFVEKHACRKKELISCLSLFLFIKTRSPVAQNSRSFSLHTGVWDPPPGVTMCYHVQLQNVVSYVFGETGQKFRSRKAGIERYGCGAGGSQAGFSYVEGVCQAWATWRSPAPKKTRWWP